jgi:hypothetical protein
MIQVKTSSGQDIQLTQPEYLNWQKTQQLPARLGGTPQPGMPRPQGGLGTPGMGQTQQDIINQQRQTTAGKSVDEQFAKDYVQFRTGGAQDSAKQLSQLKDVSNALGTKGANLTGPVIGSTPDVIKKVTNPQSIAMRERVEEVVQRSLRAILGAQFTEKEGERLIARAYNPNLSEAENKIRVDRLYTQLQQAFSAKQDAAQYFEKNNTLDGWKGKLPSIGDFDPSSGPKMPSIQDLMDEAKRRGLGK